MMTTIEHQRTVFLLVMLLCSFAGVNSGQTTKADLIDDGSKIHATTLIGFHSETGSRIAKKNLSEPFAVSFFGWKAFTIAQLPYNGYLGSHINVCGIVVGFYDNEIDATFKSVSGRTSTFSNFVEATDAEKLAIQKFIVQKYASRYVIDIEGTFASIKANKETPEKDRLGAWKYKLGASLGELAGHLTQWFALPNNGKFAELVGENLRGIDKDLKDVPAGVSPELIQNLKNLRALGSKNTFTAAEKIQIGAALQKALLSTMSFVESPVAFAIKPIGSTPSVSAVILPARTSQEHVERGKALTVKGEYQMAVTEYNTAIRLDAKNGSAFYNRALAYEKLGDADAAIRDFGTAISLMASPAGALFNRGTLYYKKGKYDHAIADFNSSISMEAGRSYVYYNRGLAYLELQNRSKALVDFTRSIQLKSDFGPVYKIRARIYCGQFQAKLAIEDENKAISLGEKIEKRCVEFK